MATPLQQKVYDYIHHYLSEHGYSPALSEIAHGIGISPNSISLISRSIHALREQGRLKFCKKGYRNLQVVETEEAFSLPLMGRIAAGTPIEAIEDKQSIDFRSLLSGKNQFVLEVKGDSMIDEGIWDGDLVICQSTRQAAENDIVVALIDQQEATLKRLSYKIKDHITLIPANPHLKPKAYPPQRVQIQGVLMGLLRLKK